jgi:glycosyltransferase involved in cell wall biosynthesis
MVEPQGTGRGFAARRDVCFLGGYTHPPNVDAVRFFAADILPRLRAHDASLGFVVAGANPGAEVRALESAHVRVTGLVPDLRDVFDPARVFVCPLRYGAGMKGKIVTAMAYGIPVVTTSIGIEGIEARDGEDVLVADGADAFAAAVMRLYGDARLWRKLSENGVRLVAERYAPAQGREALRRAIEAGFARRLAADLSAAPHGQTEIAQ